MSEYKKDKINDDEVMISTSIKDLEKMLEGVEEHTITKFEKMFIPSLIVFVILAIAGFFVIYSITVDMTKLASAMDPNMGKNMSSMTKSVEKLSLSVERMGKNVEDMNKNFAKVNQNMGHIVTKLDNLDDINTNLASVARDMKHLEPMLNNMNHMNESMVNMDKSMQRMDRDISILRDSFARPMNIINSMPFI